MVSFAQHAGASGNFDLMPNGFLCWAILAIRERKMSKNGGRYLDCELTVDDNQPFARKKLWTNIMDPLFEGNSDGAKQMGAMAVTRILETANNANPNNPAGYDIDPEYRGLNGKRVAIKVKVIPEKDGYPEKNDVAEWLTPNPQSQSGNKGYVKLLAGDHNLPVANKPASPAAFMPSGAPASPQPTPAAFTPPAPALGQPNAWLTQAQVPPK